ncbi:MAG TPA: GIY-YIG nuclease family protein [Bacteroidales bacterium]|nr:GIY-YIG nuclease family protein [Bacteroidales bacterium]
MKGPDELKKMHEKLMASTTFTFPVKGRVDVTTKQGVYIIFDPKSIVLHVGKTNRAKTGLNQRLQNHLTNHSSFSKSYLKGNGKILRTGYKFKYLEVPDARDRTILEALTIGMLCPAYVGTGEKK